MARAYSNREASAQTASASSGLVACAPPTSNSSPTSVETKVINSAAVMRGDLGDTPEVSRRFRRGLAALPVLLEVVVSVVDMAAADVLHLYYERWLGDVLPGCGFYFWLRWIFFLSFMRFRGLRGLGRLISRVKSSPTTVFYTYVLQYVDRPLNPS